MGTGIVVKLGLNMCQKFFARNEGIYLRSGYDLFACTDKRVTEIPVKLGLNGLKASYATVG